MHSTDLTAAVCIFIHRWWRWPAWRSSTEDRWRNPDFHRSGSTRRISRGRSVDWYRR